MILSNICNVIIETATVVHDDIPMSIVGSGRGRRVTAEVILQEADELNRNRRIYTKEELFPAVNSPKLQELINAPGELRSENGHPLDKNVARQAIIDPNNVVAIITKLWTDGPFVKAHVRGANNPRGDEFDMDLRDGFKPAWSLRALGRVENTARGAEVKDINIITWDRVIYPSHRKAYTQGIVSESGLYLPDDDKGMIIPVMNEQVIEMIKTESANVQRILESFELYYDNISILENGSQVSLTSVQGDTFIINLESFVTKEIRDFCKGMMG